MHLQGGFSKAYNEQGVDKFYTNQGTNYSNPHRYDIQRVLRKKLSKQNPWINIKSKILDLACGSGQITAPLINYGYTGITGTDPYTFQAYQQHTKRLCDKYSFMDIIQGCYDEVQFDCVICSYALHLVKQSLLHDFCRKLSEITQWLIVISPHKFPLLKDSYGWEESEHFVQDKVHFNQLRQSYINFTMKAVFFQQSNVLLKRAILIYSLLINIRQKEMSRYRESPSRSPFRSPPRLYETQRDAIIEDQIRLKSAIRTESDIRRMSDELSLLQVKARHTNELEAKVDGLIRQNSQLSRDNDELARELSQRRYELQRLRITASEHHERESIRNGQLFEATKALQLEIDLLKKQRLEGNRIYEANILKIERLLDEKVNEVDSFSLKCSDLGKELELTVIKFEEERNRLKNVLTRTEHELQRELQYTKEKQTNEKFSQIEALKRNHAAQVALLDDEISKLKHWNQVKTEEFESQLNENKNLRKRHDEEARLLGAQNDDLRVRMLKLEQINRSEVQNIQVKYNDYHNQGTNNLKEQHNRQIKLLLDQIDRAKWLISQKNAEIQNLLKDKREARQLLDEKQLELGSQIDSLKNQKYAETQKNTQQSHSQMGRINELINKSLRDSDSYHERVNQFKEKISKLDNANNDKQNSLDLQKRQFDQKSKELNLRISQLVFILQKTKRDLTDSEGKRKDQQNRNKEFISRTHNEITGLTRKLNEAEVKLQEANDLLQRHSEDSQGNQGLLKIEIDSLKQTISVLEDKLSQQIQNHATELNQFSTNANQKLKRLQAAQKKGLEDCEKGFQQQLQALNLRLVKLGRDKAYTESELKRYIGMYSELEKYFKQPHNGALFEQKSKDSIFKVLEKVSKSSIHIF